MRVMTEESGPLVSAVVPTYGRPEFFVDAIRSVVDQTYEWVELVVVDDCSPQPIEPRVTAVETNELERVIVRRHETNKGANAARNTGIRAANGDYVAFLDDDDRWRPEKVERQIATFRESDSSTGVTYTGLEVVDETGTRTATSIRELCGDITRELLCGAAVGSFTRLMVESSVLDRVDPLDESLRHCRYEAVTDPLAVHRRGAHDQMGDDYEGKRDVAYPRLIEKHRPLAATFGPEVERRFLASQTLALSKSAIANGYNRAARRHLLTSIRHDPTFWKPYVYLPLTSGERVFRQAKRIKSESDRILDALKPNGGLSESND
jgi:glycosyltransferase involved in cell wall biosynthesis